MAVTSFAVDSVITGLVAALQAADGFQAPDTVGTDVPVFDTFILSQEPLFASVVVGSDGSDDNTAVQRPAQFASEWHDFNLTTEEVGQVQCAVVVWAGDVEPTELVQQRADAVEILQAVDQTIRADIDAAALGVTQLLWSKVDSGQIIQGLSRRGFETRIPFTVGYRALLQVA